VHLCTYLYGVVAFVYVVIPWCCVRSASYMSAVVVLLQTLCFEWHWLSMFLDVRGWEVVLGVRVLPSVCRPGTWCACAFGWIYVVCLPRQSLLQNAPSFLVIIEELTS
jgi:hypothetical protein